MEPSKEEIVEHETSPEFVSDEISQKVYQSLLPPRTVRRHRQLLGKKILKKYLKGHTPRQIAHEAGYMNIITGEKEVTDFIKNYYKK